MNLSQHRAFDYELHMKLQRAARLRKRTQDRRMALTFICFWLTVYVVIASWL